jgi:hypothetical protein
MLHFINRRGMLDRVDEVPKFHGAVAATRFDWSPDGKYLLLERGANINDVVLLSEITG